MSRKPYPQVVALSNFSFSGVVPPPDKDPRNMNVIEDGDSIAAAVGAGISIVECMNVSTIQVGTSTWGTVTYSNIAVAGSTIQDRTAALATDMAPLLLSDVENVIILVCGTNDIANQQWTPAETEAFLWEYCDTVRNLPEANGKIIRIFAATVLPRGNGGSDFDTDRATYNTLISSNFAGHCDGILRFASDTRMGQDGQENNPEWYQDESGARVHPTFPGQCVLFAHTMRVIRGFYSLPYAFIYGPVLELYVDGTNASYFLNTDGDPVQNGELIGVVTPPQGFQKTDFSTGAGIEPTWVSSSVNGHSAFRSDGTKVISTPLLSRFGFTLVLLAKLDNVAPGAASEENGGYSYFQNKVDASTYVSNGADGSAYNATPAGPVDNMPHLIMHVFRGTHLNDSLLIDGVEQAKVTYAGLNADVGTTQFNNVLKIGGASGDYGAWCWYAVQLSDQEIAEVSSLANSLWGLS